MDDWGSALTPSPDGGLPRLGTVRGINDTRRVISHPQVFLSFSFTHTHTLTHTLLVSLPHISPPHLLSIGPEHISSSLPLFSLSPSLSPTLLPLAPMIPTGWYLPVFNIFQWGEKAPDPAPHPHDDPSDVPLSLSDAGHRHQPGDTIVPLLHFYAARGDLEALTALLDGGGVGVGVGVGIDQIDIDAGISVVARDHHVLSGVTPLYLAASGGHATCAAALEAAGASRAGVAVDVVGLTCSAEQVARLVGVPLGKAEEESGRGPMSREGDHDDHDDRDDHLNHSKVA